MLRPTPMKYVILENTYIYQSSNRTRGIREITEVDLGKPVQNKYNIRGILIPYLNRHLLIIFANTDQQVNSKKNLL